MVNYCDFTCYWDWQNFKKFVSDSNCIGSIPAYKGFHPHSLGNTNYAYLKEQNGLVSDIQEKQPYTNNRMDEFASSGTYYFASGEIMIDAFRSVIEQDLNVNGEYYVSLAYKILLANDNLVTVYPLQHFMQWGTPDDVDEYNSWSAIFSRLMTPSRIIAERKGSCIIPMAGLGQRFVNEGYSLTKPLIEFILFSPNLMKLRPKLNKILLRFRIKNASDFFDAVGVFDELFSSKQITDDRLTYFKYSVHIFLDHVRGINL